MQERLLRKLGGANREVIADENLPNWTGLLLGTLSQFSPFLQAEKEAFEEAEKERKAREDRVRMKHYDLWIIHIQLDLVISMLIIIYDSWVKRITKSC
jgi:hypothetical protein